MTKVKITVIKKFSPIDVFGHEVYSTSGTKIVKCGAFEEGQEFIVEHIEKMPEGFCGWAWRDIYKDLSVLNFGGNFWPNWMNPGEMFTCCTDGVRPVTFKLERLEE